MKKKKKKPTLTLERQKSVGSSPETCRYEYDFDYLVFNDDSETDEDVENEDGVIIEKWSKTKKHRLLKCMWKLKYNRIISSFYLDSLKKKEGKLSDIKFENIEYFSFDVTNNEIANLFGVQYQTTLLIFKGDQEVYRSIGETTEELIYEALKISI